MENRYSSYNIVDKPEGFLPRGENGKWQSMFDPLPSGKAICFDCPSEQSARRLAATIQGSLRQSRKVAYRIRFRIVPDGDGYKVYVWKE